MPTPTEILKHSSKFKDKSWKNYSYEELAQWINLLSKRASHRTDIDKCRKDLEDANNYLAMLNGKFFEEGTNIEKSFEREE